MSSRTEMAWQMIMNFNQFSDTNITRSQKLQYQTFKQANTIGEAQPMALEPGEKAIKPFIFREPGEDLERMAPSLITARA